MDSDDKKITQLARVTSLSDSDLFVVVVDVGTSPVTKAIEKSNALGVPQARAYNNTDISIPDSTLTTIALPNERYDNDNIHDNSTNNSRLTCKTAGLYAISATLLFKPNATGRRFIVVLLNGTTYIAQDETYAGAANYPTLNVYTEYPLAVNDYIEIQAFQSSGGDLDTFGSAGIGVEFMMSKK